MAASCCDHCPDPIATDAAYRRVLWGVLTINSVMFLVEIGAGLAAGSASLQADALDFFADAANYGISLFVVGMALRYSAMAALAKGATMGVFGLWTASWPRSWPPSRSKARPPSSDSRSPSCAGRSPCPLNSFAFA